MLVIPCWILDIHLDVDYPVLIIECSSFPVSVINLYAVPKKRPGRMNPVRFGKRVKKKVKSYSTLSNSSALSLFSVWDSEISNPRI